MQVKLQQIANRINKTTKYDAAGGTNYYLLHKGQEIPK